MFVPKSKNWLISLIILGLGLNACRNAEMRPPNNSETLQIDSIRESSAQAANEFRYALKRLIIFNRFKRRSSTLDADINALMGLDKRLRRLCVPLDSALTHWQENPKNWTIQQQNRLQTSILAETDSLPTDLGTDFPLTKALTDTLQTLSTLLMPQTFHRTHPFVALWAYKLGIYQAAQATISHISSQYAVPDLRGHEFLACAIGGNYHQNDTKLFINILEFDYSPFQLKNSSKSPRLDIYAEYPIHRLVDSSRSALQNLSLTIKNIATGESESTIFVFE